MRITCLCTLVLLLVLAAPVYGQVPPTQQQIAAAVSPAPSEFQEGAAVLGYKTEGGPLVTLREGTNELVCLADDPSDDRFHVACYHASLEPFMARGRELKAQGKSRDEVKEIREEEANAGTLKMPEHPAMLYSLNGSPDSFDPASGSVEGASRLTVVYMPWATAETTGLPTRAPAGSPWIMNPGKPWAHIMLIHPQSSEEPEADN